MTEQIDEVKKSESELIEDELEKFSSENSIDLNPKPDEKKEDEEKKNEEKKESPDETDKSKSPGDEASVKDASEDSDKEKKPEEKAEDAIKEKEPDDSRDEQILDDSKRKDNVAFAKMRHKEKTLEAKVDELTSKLQELASEPRTEKKEAQKRPSADVLFSYLVRAESGELTEAEIAALGGNEDIIKSNLDEVISEELTSSEVLELQKMARNNKFGEQSQVILEKTRGYMPSILAREREADSTKHGNEENAAKIMETYNVEIKKAAEDFPELAVDDAKIEKTIEDWERENIGEVDGLIVKKPGKLPQELAQYLMLHPYERARVIASELRGSAVIMKELEQYRGKVKDLEDKLKLSDSPESGSPSGTVKSKEIETSADIERQLEEISSQRSA